VLIILIQTRDGKNNIKNTDTMKTMEFISAGEFKVSELMENDMIKIDDDIVTIIDIEDDGPGDNYFVRHENEFGEIEVTQFYYTESVELFVITDE
jgi:hypothetical protein